MEVRAVKRGFYDGIYRRIGDKFDCPSDQVSKIWMRPVTKGEVEQKVESDGYTPLEIPSLMNKPKKKVKKIKK
jgi:hypothetical protein